MPYDIYTDDGVVHPQQSKIIFYANEAKTQKIPFIAENEVGRIQDLKEVEASGEFEVVPDEGYVALRQVKVNVTPVEPDHGFDDITFTEDKAILGDGNYNDVHHLIPTTGAVTTAEKNMIYDSDEKAIVLKSPATAGWIQNQNIDVSRDFRVMAVPTTGADIIPASVKWTELTTMTAEGNPITPLNTFKTHVGANYTGWCCYRFTHDVVGPNAQNMVSVDFYFADGTPLVHEFRYWTTSHTAKLSDYKFLASGDNRLNIWNSMIVSIDANGDLSFFDAIFYGAKSPAGTKIERVLIPMNFTTMQYTE